MLDETTLTKQSNPYVVACENTTDEQKTVQILGDNIFNSYKNSDNPEGIVLSSAISSTSYRHICAQIAHRPCKIELVYVQCTKMSEGWTPCISLVHSEADGCMSTVPYYMNYNPDQMQSTVVNKKVSFFLDGNSYLKFDLPAKTKIHISLYPIYTISLGHILKSLLGLPSYRVAQVKDENDPIKVSVKPRFETVGKVKSFFKRMAQPFINGYKKFIDFLKSIRSKFSKKKVTNYGA